MQLALAQISEFLQGVLSTCARLPRLPCIYMRAWASLAGAELLRAWCRHPVVVVVWQTQQTGLKKAFQLRSLCVHATVPGTHPLAEREVADVFVGLVERRQTLEAAVSHV
jgi:hypothetical protein